MRSVKVTLGERDYLVTELPLRKNMAWRASVKRRFGPVLDLVLQGRLSSETLRAANPDSMIDLFMSVAGPLIESPESIWESIVEYSPEIAEDSDRILDTTTDTETIGVFLRLLELAYPFGGLIRQLIGQADATGPSEAPTTPRLPVLNGASGTTS